jgi:phosphoglycerate dehydrogenase-like enzyme
LVVGTGGIGREIARLLRAVGLQVRGAGRTARTNDVDFGDVVASADLVDQVGWCDYLINAVPLTPQTRGLINADVFAALRPSAHLVNVGRGATVVQHELAEALAAGRFDGASLDVFEEEPLPVDSPLWSIPGVRRRRVARRAGPPVRGRRGAVAGRGAAGQRRRHSAGLRPEPVSPGLTGGH